MQLTYLKSTLKPLLSVQTTDKEDLHLLVQDGSLSFILLRNNNRYFDIKASISTTNSSISSEFTARINFKKFRSILTKLKTKDIGLEISSEVLKLNKMPISLEPSLAVEDLNSPFIAELAAEKNFFGIWFPAAALQKYISTTRYCTSLDAARNSLQSVWFMLNEDYHNIGAVATDGQKLSYASMRSILDLKLLVPTAIQIGIGIPFFICDLISKLSFTEDSILSIVLSRDFRKLSSAKVILSTENIKINFTAKFNYPNWLSCIPDLQDENTASFTVSLSDLIDKLESYTPFIRTKNKFILFELDKTNNKIDFKLSLADNPSREIVGSIPASFTNVENKTSKLAFNSTYLLEHLKRMFEATGKRSDNTIALHYTTEIAPTTFSFVGKDKDIRYHYKLIMPLRLLDENDKEFE
jgi:DNA polymerase III sliding clamp (beta) subunit (PCNA family)